ncbi:MAG: cyanophycin synthetase [Candidatus Peregrinibacteria bacterium]|nr:cyanophycin synthetase [Candidatus Peregrinibacteria bacterium]MDZ4244381.1 cyanophycin synthetase [Candidatus Gracilibacteria bacterium]
MKKKEFFYKGRHIHMVGVSGIGMSALSAFLLDKGCKVTGSDTVQSNDIPSKVKFLGEQSEKNIKKGIDLVIASHAISIDNEELKKSLDLKIPVLTYPEAVGRLTDGFKLICVSGTHGKSTTTSMLSRILIDAGLDPNIIVGTRVPELDGKNYRIGKSNLFLLESCEYKESFLHYHPDVLVITNIEPDHLDHYVTEDNYFRAFKEYLENVKKGGVVIANGDDAPSLDVIEGYEGHKEIVSFLNNAPLNLKVIGKHNQYNAWHAIFAAKSLGVKEEDAIKSLEKFEGTWRRLEYKGDFNGAKVYDDYGHHPTEVTVTLSALKHEFPHKKIVCVFQPHQYSRMISFFDEFVESLQAAYYVIIPDIYEVRDAKEDIDEVDVDEFVQAINEYEGIDRAVNGEGLDNTANILKRILTHNDICVIMGAGNVTQICDLLLK